MNLENMTEFEQIAQFVSWCIEEYAAEKHITAKSVANLFYKNGTLDFLEKNWEVLHSQGRNYILDSINEFKKRPIVTQQNVRLFIPHKVAKICGELHKSQNLSLKEAILKFYNSDVATTLSRESSKLWQEGWVYIYENL